MVPLAMSPSRWKRSFMAAVISPNWYSGIQARLSEEERQAVDKPQEVSQHGLPSCDRLTVDRDDADAHEPLAGSLTVPEGLEQAAIKPIEQKPGQQPHASTPESHMAAPKLKNRMTKNQIKPQIMMRISTSIRYAGSRRNGPAKQY